jgi:hypothetical protein
MSARLVKFAAAFCPGDKACSSRILGIGADSGHHEHRTQHEGGNLREGMTINLPQIDFVPHPRQNTSSHGVPAIRAARIVGDHGCQLLIHRSMTARASARAAASATRRLAFDGNVCPGPASARLCAFVKIISSLWHKKNRSFSKNRWYNAL